MPGKSIRTHLTYDNFRTFVLSKPAEDRFDFCNNNNCAVAQFVKSLGHNYASVGGWKVSIPEEVPIPEPIFMAMDRMLEAPRPYIFTWGHLSSFLPAVPL